MILATATIALAQAIAPRDTPRLAERDTGIIRGFGATLRGRIVIDNVEIVFSRRGAVVSSAVIDDRDSRRLMPRS